MPYKSKAERERELYADMLEAIAEFAAVDHCSEADALVQLRKALADNMLICRWGDGFGYGLYGDTDWGEWWLKAKIRGDGKVLDNHMLMPDDDMLTGERPFRRVSRYRTLLIRRDSLSRLLPLIAAPVALPAAGPAEREAAPRPLTKAEKDAAYKQYIAEPGHHSRDDEEAWGRPMGIKRPEVRQMRKRRLGEAKKGGRPKRR